MNEALRALLHLKDPLGKGGPITLTQQELEELCEKIEDEWVCVEPHDDYCMYC